MFERYTESARRVLFVARYELTQLGGVTIEPEHLVLGLLRDESSPLRRFLRPPHTIVGLRSTIVEASARNEKLSTSAEVPFSAASKEALQRAAVEADTLNHERIGPDHLLLGVLVSTFGPATQALRDAGLDADTVRARLRTDPHEVKERPSGFAYRPGTVVRTWKGVVKPGSADDYVRHLKTETFPALRHLDGHVSASMMRRDVEDGTEFLVTTVWRSLDAVKAFAGDDVTAAVVPAVAQSMMVRYDDRAVHYEIVF